MVTTSLADFPPRPARRLIVLSEFPRDASPTGVARRIDHISEIPDLEDVFEEAAIHLHCHPGDGQRNYVQRVIALIASWRSMRRELSRHSDAITVVVGLGAPHMLLLAVCLSRAGSVVFDACDSWQLQTRARAVVSRRYAFLAVAGAILQRLAPRRLSVAYISLDDAQADSDLNAGREVFVIPPSVPPELLDLDEVTLPLERLVIVGDFSSFHNRRGLSIIYEALHIMDGNLTVPVEAYGPNVLPGPVPPVIEYRGWAESLADVYRGNTGVLITNTAGSGIPNKVIEAIASKRVVFLHQSLGPRFWGDRVRTFADARELVEEVRIATAQPWKGIEGGLAQHDL